MKTPLRLDCVRLADGVAESGIQRVEGLRGMAEDSCCNAGLAFLDIQDSQTVRSDRWS